MEESKELQGTYTLFRGVIYVTLLLEFFMYAYSPEDLDFLGGIITGIHSQLQHLSVYQFLPYSKIVTLIMVIITCIGTKNKKQIEYDARRMVFWPISSGLLITLLSVGIYYWDWNFKIGILRGNIWLYMLLSIVGTILVHVALDNISKYFRSGMLKDRFNLENESFEQSTECISNAYSVNIPMRFYYQGKFRHGWINIINPFRGTWVVGTPGSGKTFSVIEPYIRQHSQKGFSMVVYDYKFPTLATKLYYHYRKNKELHRLPEGCKFRIINFVNVEYSCRVNPIQQ